MMIRNPVIRGCNPDPSFIRVGEDYYLATSTFEWFPGVPIYHSRDLMHWRLIGHALSERRLLDLRGVPDSGGVWAPSLSYDAGTFYLVYTIVRTRVGNFKDVDAFLITAPTIHGPWSERIYLHSIGFDPSLFHDDDGRKWVVNFDWDFRPGQPRFGGIVIQEYDPAAQQLIGARQKILTKAELMEGPNIYKVGGWYYLMVAEGGTGWNHGISLARSRSLDGPFEVDPGGALLTSRDDPALALQKAGHGEIVETQAGEWYLAHLCSRPVGRERRCILGRETALQKVQWSADGWLRLAHGGCTPAETLAAPLGLPVQAWPVEPTRDDFDRERLSLPWNSLRRPVSEDWLSLAERPGFLRLRGRESAHSLFDQSLIAQRVSSFRLRVETKLDFSPTHFAQMAGLIFWYDTRTHYYLRVTHDERRGGKVLGVVLTDDGVYKELPESAVTIDEWASCFLGAEMEGETLQFVASPNGAEWQPIGPALDATKLSDDYGQGLHFTGAFVGLCAQDLAAHSAVADFAFFEMQELPPPAT